MNMIQKLNYNISQSEKYGWGPDWFDCETFGEDLIHSIIEFQKEHGLDADGLCGPSTYRRKWTEREADGDYNEERIIPQGKKYIVSNGRPVVINWDKVVLWNQPGGLIAKPGTYTDKTAHIPRDIRYMVLHWDAALSSKSCARILRKRGLSCTFCIDNDGTIFQLMDTQHVAWCNGSKHNGKSIGVEVSNAVYEKWNPWYERNGFGKRPIMRGKMVHGKFLKPFLGFYPIQLEALAALMEAVSRALDIPLVFPQTKNGVDAIAAAGNLWGFCAHYHLTSKKWDIAGVDGDELLNMAKKARYASQI